MEAPGDGLLVSLLLKSIHQEHLQLPLRVGHFLPFSAPYGRAFVTFCTLLKLIPTYIPGWGLGVYFDWCIFDNLHVYVSG